MVATEQLVVATPQGPAPASLTVVLRDVLQRAYGSACHVRDHSPVEGTVDSIPEPDVAVVRGDARAFTARHPGPADVALVVEVARTTLALDRRKADVYAAAGCAVYWLVDVEGRRVELRTSPTGGVYAKTEIVGADGVVDVPGTDVRLAVVELLP